MKGAALIIGLLAACVWAVPVNADIYVWTGADGVRHFTNLQPPPDADIVMHVKERPGDKAAEPVQEDADMKRQLEQAQAHVRRQAERLAERQAEMERRVAEAERRAAEALQRAENLETTLMHQRNETINRHTTSYVYYPYKFKHRHDRSLKSDRRFHHELQKDKIDSYRKGHHRIKRHRFEHNRQLDRRFKYDRDRHVGRPAPGDHHLRKKHYVTGPLRTRPYVGSWSGMGLNHHRGFNR